MSDTRMLLGKITALRQRLEQGQEPKGPAAAPPAGDGTLEERVAEGRRQQALIDSSLHQLAGCLMGPNEILPTKLTARARQLLERGRELIGQLRRLADEPVLQARPAAADANGSAPEADPLVLSFRETAAMAETALRMVQAFPDAPSAQLRLSEGLEGILTGVSDRIAQLGRAAAQRRHEAERVDCLAHLLTQLDAGLAPPLQTFVMLAETIIAEAQQAAPLRFHYLSPTPGHGLPGTLACKPQAHFIACHSLTVAQVIARLARHDPEYRGQPQDAVLAALLADVGMLKVPAEVLAQAGPLTDEQKRTIEAHPREGAELVARALAPGSDVTDAIAGHHERLDGTGYPGGLKADQLGRLARLLAVADVYAALACPRPHRGQLDPRTALTDTLLQAEHGELDRHWAEQLLHLGFYPVGSVVELGDGSVALVVATHSNLADLNLPGRPVVAVLADPRGHLLPTPRHLDLAASDGGTVVRTLPPAQRRQLLGKRYPELA